MNVEWLVLADYAQVVANKLYLMGGGWDKLTVNSPIPPPLDHHLAVAVAFSVPWGETNRRIPWELEIVDDDGHRLGKVDGQLEVGRPAGMPLGQDQRAQIAARIGIRFNQLGNYAVVVAPGEGEPRRFSFSLVPGPMLTRSQQAKEGGRNQ